MLINDEHCELISRSNLLNVSTTWWGTFKTAKYPDSSMFCFQYEKGFCWLVAPLLPVSQTTSNIYSIQSDYTFILYYYYSVILYIQCEGILVEVSPSLPVRGFPGGSTELPAALEGTTLGTHALPWLE